MENDVTLIFFLVLAFAVTFATAAGIVYARRSEALDVIKNDIVKGKKKLKKLKKKAKKLENGREKGTNS